MLKAMLKKGLKEIYYLHWYMGINRLEKRNIKKKKNLVDKVKLTKEQENAIEELWIKNYGKKIPTDWHKLYTSYTGKFDPNYFPEIYFTNNLLHKLNPRNISYYLSDKVLIQYFFKELDNKKYKIAKDYIYNSNGYFYDENGIITYDEAINKLKNIGVVIIKPTIGTDSGKGVAMLNIENGIDLLSKTKIEEILKQYHKNYTIQEKIVQHEAYAKLNPSSVNTIRMHSYICDGEVFITPIALRIGRSGSIVDNAHSGGIGVGVNENGYLMEFGFLEYGEKFLKHPDTNVVFKEYKLPKIPEMIEFVKKYHYRIPHIGIIAWDLTIDENEKIVVIEANLTYPGIWFSQMLTGQSFFGENTEKMIRLLKEKEDRQ